MIRIKLIWSIRALDEYEHLLDYLMAKWGEAITKRVIDNLSHHITRIQTTSEQFPILIKSKNVRRCVTSPQTSIFFRISKDSIVILSIFDNRQNPKKKEF